MITRDVSVVLLHWLGKTWESCPGWFRGELMSRAFLDRCRDAPRAPPWPVGIAFRDWTLAGRAGDTKTAVFVTAASGPGLGRAGDTKTAVFVTAASSAAWRCRAKPSEGGDLPRIGSGGNLC